MEWNEIILYWVRVNESTDWEVIMKWDKKQSNEIVSNGTNLWNGLEWIEVFSGMHWNEIKWNEVKWGKIREMRLNTIEWIRIKKNGMERERME